MKDKKVQVVKIAGSCVEKAESTEVVKKKEPKKRKKIFFSFLVDG